MSRAAILALVAGCATGHGERVLEFSTGCLGWCRSYTVDVYEDRTLEYMGYTNVGLGRRSATVSPAQLAALESMLASAFSHLDPHAMGCPDVYDNGTLVAIDYRYRTVAYFDLCTEVPWEARRLADRIGVLLALDRWIDER